MIGILKISWLGVWSRLGRSILTALSLFVGVFAIVIIQSGATAARDAVVANAVLTNGRALTVGLNTEVDRRSFAQADQLKTVLDRALTPVGATSVITVDIGGISIGDGAAEGSLVKGNLRKIKPFPIRAGQWIASRSGIALPLVVNEAASMNLKLKVGSTVLVKISQVNEGMTAKIIGIVVDGSKEPTAYAPLDLSLSWVKELAYLRPARILVQIGSVTDFDELRRVIKTEYSRVFENPNTPEIIRLDTQESFDKTLTSIGQIFSVIAALSLIVGALGILNIGLATLRERSDELSLRRSFGATKLQVAAIIVLEGQIVALAAAGIALLVGIVSFPLLASALSKGIDISNQSFPIVAAEIGVIASCAAAFAGSITPAIRASRVPISSIMRI